MKRIGKIEMLTLVYILHGLLLFTSCAQPIEEMDNVDSKEQSPFSSVTGYPIVGTNQALYYDELREINAPNTREAFYGQNATYPGHAPDYKDNEDGTITDAVTGLMWTQSPDLDGDGSITASDKLTYDEALRKPDEIRTGGYDDWRLPTIKELYSLILFSGIDPSGYNGSSEGLVPFIDTRYFDFAYGDESAGERIIDAQFATSTLYVSFTMGGNDTMFGVNFADGRIKGYPAGATPMGKKTYYILFVRGNTGYGTNQLVDNGDGSITDEATGLMWMQEDNGTGITWKEALAYAENLEFAGYSDWRLPDAKELQSIVDYNRSPATDNTASIDPLFSCSELTAENGQKDFPFYWSSTTHVNMSLNQAGSSGAYVCFGSGLGNMHGTWMDVHGAGAQRSDPKMGNPDDYPQGHGPQGDAVRIYNYVRLVRNVN